MVDAELKVTDFMPMQLGAPTVVRVVESVYGAVDVVMHLTIRFSSGLTVPWVRQIKGGITAVAGPDALVLRSDVEIRGKKEDLSSIASFRVEPGAKKTFVLSWYLSHQEPPDSLDVDSALVETERYWEIWAANSLRRIALPNTAASSKQKQEDRIYSGGRHRVPGADYGPLFGFNDTWQLIINT